MNHRQHYIELNPEPQTPPPQWAIWCGAALAVIGLWLVTVFLFSL